MAVLEMKNISKEFPGTKALDQVDFSLEAGEIHALMGQNGAGKSTLMKIMSGVYSCDSGAILLEGKEIRIRNPKDALQHGISIISQELSLCPYLSIAENIFLGRLPMKRGTVDWSGLYQQADQVLKEIGVDLNPHTKAGELSVAQKQLVEIAKAMSRDTKILLMDEATSALTPSEIESLFKFTRDLQKKGLTIVYISHKMDEIFELCQRMTVLKDGKLIGVYTTEEMTPVKVTELMVGKNLGEYFSHDSSEFENKYFDRVRLSVKGLNRKGVLKNISFELYEGEVLGLSGLMGAGRTETLRAIYGVDRIASGEFFIDGEEYIPKAPKEAMKNGIAFITEERKEQVLFLEMSVGQNLTIASLNQLSKAGFMNSKEEVSLINDYFSRLSVKAASHRVKVKSLSGGNQQKVIISRWLAAKPKILLMDEPTRGIDVGAKQEIYNLIRDLAKEGYSILVVSSELPEIKKICDRVLIMNQGKIAGSLNNKELDDDVMNAMMSQIASD